MITSSIAFGIHILVSSFRMLRPVGQLFELVLPFRNMATKAVQGKINFNTKHLKKGDPLPPYNGKLRVYNMRYCPYAQRTLLALLAKNIDFEVVNINLVEKPEWLSEKSPFGKVPSIEIKDGVTIYESLVTVEYLDEVYPQRPLLPKDPVKKAYDKILVEAISPLQTVMSKTLKAPDTITEENIAAFYKALDFIQTELKKRGTTFLDGKEPGFADYMIWPWFERMVLLEDNSVVKIDAQYKLNKKYKLLLDYLNKMGQDPVVTQYLVPKEIMLKFAEAYKLGNAPDYDLLLEN